MVLTGEPARLGRAINNLVDNAVNYSPPGSPVEIALHGGELTVRDHGPGISSADLPHVFDRFYRGAEARGTARARASDWRSCARSPNSTAAASAPNPRRGAAP